MGKGPFGSFVADLCEKVGTSKRYTKDCVRFTGTNVTKSGEFNNKEVMNFNGHKSVQSLTINQRVSSERKMEMAKTIIDAMKKKEDAKPSTNETVNVQAIPVQVAVLVSPP